MATEHNDYYVYLHRRGDNNEVFYVGKGRCKRAKSKSGRNLWWQRIVTKHGFTVEFLEVGLSETDALDLEMETIKFYKDNKHELCNITDGGEGTSGAIKSKEAREKIRKYHKDRPKTFEHRVSLSAATCEAGKILCSNGVVFFSLVHALDWLRQINPKAVTSRVTKCCRRESRSAYGFVWRFLEDCDDVMEILLAGEDPYVLLNKVTKKTSVVCSNGMLFESMSAAAQWCKENIKPTASVGGIAACCRGEVSKACGLEWSLA